MIDPRWLPELTVALLILLIGLVTLLVARRRPERALHALIEDSEEHSERNLREEFARNREEMAVTGGHLREEINRSVQRFGDLVLGRMAEMTHLQQSQLEIFSRQLARLSQQTD